MVAASSLCPETTHLRWPDALVRDEQHFLGLGRANRRRRRPALAAALTATKPAAFAAAAGSDSWGASAAITTAVATTVAAATCRLLSSAGSLRHLASLDANTRVLPDDT